jgi:hypothetical protein
MKNFIAAAVRLIVGLLLAATVTAAGAAEIREGDYYIVSKHSYKALTAFEGRHGEIVLGQSARKPNDGPAQLWTITRATGETNDATYQIRSRKYGKYLAGGDDDENGDTSVVLEDEQSAEQAWRFKPHLDSYGIELDDSGTTLNVRANERADDARIIVYDASLDDNAQWLLYPAGNGDRPAAAAAEVSEFDNLNKRYRLAPMPAATPEANRLRRTKLMDDQPSGVFVKRGEAVSVMAEGLISGAKVDTKRLEWLAGPPKVNVNVASARKSSSDNLLACDFIDGPLSAVQKQPVTLHCAWIEENYDTELKP